MTPRRLVVGISGSSGSIMGIRLLEALRSLDIETHLVVSPSSRLTIEQETNWTLNDVTALADVNYTFKDIGATIASGSYATLGMVVIPCSIKTLSAIATSYTDNLLVRAADVTLKEGRPLILVVREAPLHAGHLRLMEQAAANGAVIFPPIPAFYSHPQSLDDVVDNLIGRVLARIGIENPLFTPWAGLDAAALQSHAIPAGLLALSSLTLATAGRDGQPHAAPVYFAADTEDPATPLYFFSQAGSQHGADLAANPAAAVAIYPMVHGWRDIRGLQLRGEAHPLEAGPQFERAMQLYVAKFPFVAAFQEVMTKNRLYVFRPNWVRLLDNSRGFSFKEEWQPGPPAE